ncbi:MAG: DNA polymerase III subunit alpha [Clostridia bacterium]|nr:DNA polymerase III subunit alpha [Clostridia bacterium]
MFSGSIHTHSENSITDSVASVSEIAFRAKEMGAPAIALTDHGVLIGVWDFLDACKKAQIKGVVGVEFYVGNDGSREHLVVLAKNEQGYQAISKAVTASNYNVVKDKPIANIEILRQWFGEGSIGHNNVIATSACVGGVLASVFLSNENYEKEQNKLLKKKEKESNPDSPLYKQMCDNFHALENEVDELKQKKIDCRTIASKKYAQRLKRAEKNNDEQEIARIREEEKESLKCQKLLPEIEKQFKAKQKSLTELRNRKKLVEESHAKFIKYQSEIDALETKKMTEEQMNEVCIEKMFEYQSLFGSDNFYIELQYHGIPNEEKIMPILAEIADAYGIPVVASNDIHCIYREDAEARAVNFAQKHWWTGIADSDWELYMKSDEELSEWLLKILPSHIVSEAINNISTILSRCNLEFESKTHYPKFDCPEGAKTRLRNLIEQGKYKVPNWTLEYEERIKYELSVIETLGFSDYLCVVEDFLTYARLLGKVDITDPRFLEDPFNMELLKELGKDNVGEGVGPGRGSGAGSLVCYLIGITDIDPLKYNLLFERFLNPERVTMPDIDSDIAIHIRQFVIDYMKHKYGANAVCQIMTRNYFLSKNAIRAAGRAYAEKINDGRRFYEISDTMSKMITDKMKLADIEDLINETYGKDAGENYNSDALEIYRFAKMIEGKLCTIGTHAAGVVISDTPDISDHLPLICVEGTMSCQCDKNRVETLGCLKMDALGLRNLSLITDCERAILKTYNKKISIHDIPIRDEVFKKIFQTAKTNCVFQFESDGMKNVLTGFCPDKFEDLILLNAVFRPGPLQYIEEITAVKNGERKPEYVIPEMAEVLDETYGKPVYQEQLMTIFSRFAGFTLGEADIIRRLMSKKKVSEFVKYKDKFINGLVSHGAVKSKAEEFWSELVKFSEYAFNKSHSTVYAWLAYVTAYFKLYYPECYAAGSLNYPANEKFNSTLKEFLSMGIEISAPDVNKAFEGFTVTSNKLIYGLSSIAGMKKASEKIVAERKLNGVYTSFTDFALRTRTAKNVFCNMIKAGCFDSLHSNRKEMLEAVSYVNETASTINDKQQKLEAETDEAKRAKLISSIESYKKKLDDWCEPVHEDQKERLNDELSVLGHFISQHPLDTVTIPKTLKYNTLNNLDDKLNTILVYVSNVQFKIKKADGKEFAFFDAEDKTGQINCACFTKNFAICGHNIKDNSILIVKGKKRYDSKNETSFFNVEDVQPFIEEPKTVEISVPTLLAWEVEQDIVLPYQEHYGDRLVVFIEEIGKYIETDLIVSRDIVNAKFNW